MIQSLSGREYIQIGAGSWMLDSFKNDEFPLQWYSVVEICRNLFNQLSLGRYSSRHVQFFTSKKLLQRKLVYVFVNFSVSVSME